MSANGVLALGLGLLAALAWGVHDLFVRRVSQHVSIITALVTVLVIGSVVTLPVAVGLADWERANGAAIIRALAAGAIFTGGGYALYRAFAIGPVRLVAPIVGSYPVLSIGWAFMQGQVIATGHWFAVGAVVLGIAIVAVLSDEDQHAEGSRIAAMVWAALAAVGFALSFAQGQWATDLSDEFLSITFTRIGAVTAVLTIALVLRARLIPPRAYLPLLFAMGLLDSLALGSVIAAGGLPNAAFAAVASSLFGVVTVLLAWLFLAERMTLGQWAGVAIVFGAIGYLAL